MVTLFDFLWGLHVIEIAFYKTKGICQNSQLIFTTQTGRVVGAGQVDRDQARAQDYLDNLDEIDHMVMDFEAAGPDPQPGGLFFFKRLRLLVFFKAAPVPYIF